MICSSLAHRFRVVDEGLQDLIERNGVVATKPIKVRIIFIRGVDGFKIDFLEGKYLPLDYILHQRPAQIRHQMVILALGQSVF